VLLPFLEAQINLLSVLVSHGHLIDDVLRDSHELICWLGRGLRGTRHDRGDVAVDVGLVRDHLALVSLRDFRVLRAQAPAVAIHKVPVVVGEADPLVLAGHLRVEAHALRRVPKVHLRVEPLLVVFLGDVVGRRRVLFQSGRQLMVTRHRTVIVFVNKPGREEVARGVWRVLVERRVRLLGREALLRGFFVVIADREGREVGAELGLARQIPRALGLRRLSLLLSWLHLFNFYFTQFPEV
jgi:hypothetical protein